MTRVSTHPWGDLQSKFQSSFLSEDYEDELAERAQTQIQGEDESIRDFAYMYHSLCCCWKPGITEEAVMKFILRNINPCMASQLRGRVNTVEELVRLGQQLEKDKMSQTQYDQWKKKKTKQTERQRRINPSTLPSDTVATTSIHIHQPQQNPALPHNPVLCKYFVGGVKVAILLMLVQMLTSRENTTLRPRRASSSSHGSK